MVPEIYNNSIPKYLGTDVTIEMNMLIIIENHSKFLQKMWTETIFTFTCIINGWLPVKKKIPVEILEWSSPKLQENERFSIWILYLCWNVTTNEYGRDMIFSEESTIKKIASSDLETTNFGELPKIKDI